MLQAHPGTVHANYRPVSSPPASALASELLTSGACVLSTFINTALRREAGTWQLLINTVCPVKALLLSSDLLLLPNNPQRPGSVSGDQAPAIILQLRETTWTLLFQNHRMKMLWGEGRETNSFQTLTLRWTFYLYQLNLTTQGGLGLEPKQPDPTLLCHLHHVLLLWTLSSKLQWVASAIVRES